MDVHNQFQIQLEHGMGYNGLTKNSLILHPNLVDYIYIAGGVIVIAEIIIIMKIAHKIAVMDLKDIKIIQIPIRIISEIPFRKI